MKWRAAERLLLSVWLGGATFLTLIAAPAAFRSSPNSNSAADVVGAMLTPWHYVALIIPLLLLLIEWKGLHLRNTMRVWILAVALLFAALQAAADLKVREIRNDSPVPISSLARQNPIRRKFGRLHGISSVLMLLQIGCGIGIAVTKSEES